MFPIRRKIGWFRLLCYSYTALVLLFIFYSLLFYVTCDADPWMYVCVDLMRTYIRQIGMCIRGNACLDVFTCSAHSLLCLWIHLCALCVYLYASIPLREHIFVRACRCVVSLYTYVCLWMYCCVCTCVHLSVYARVYLRIHLRMCARDCVRAFHVNRIYVHYRVCVHTSAHDIFLIREYAHLCVWVSSMCDSLFWLWYRDRANSCVAGHRSVYWVAFRYLSVKHSKCGCFLTTYLDRVKTSKILWPCGCDTSCWFPIVYPAICIVSCVWWHSLLQKQDKLWNANEFTDLVLHAHIRTHTRRSNSHAHSSTGYLFVLLLSCSDLSRAAVPSTLLTVAILINHWWPLRNAPRGWIEGLLEFVRVIVNFLEIVLQQFCDYTQ